MAEKALLVLSGERPPRDAVLAERPALVVAVDGGGEHLAAWDVVPDVVVGDMDSISPATLERFRLAGARVERHPRDKLHTDARLALDLALREGAREIVLVGSAGGRLDLTIANLGLVVRGVEAGARVRAVEASGRLWSLAPDAPLALDLPPGQVLSVLALTHDVRGLHLAGVRWPLPRAGVDPAEGASLAPADPYAVSNEALGGPVEARIASGIAALVVPYAP